MKLNDIVSFLYQNLPLLKVSKNFYNDILHKSVKILNTPWLTGDVIFVLGIIFAIAWTFLFYLLFTRTVTVMANNLAWFVTGIFGGIIYSVVCLWFILPIWISNTKLSSIAMADQNYLGFIGDTTVYVFITYLIVSFFARFVKGSRAAGIPGIGKKD